MQIDQYIKRRSLYLGASIEKKLKVYLDTKYWLLLRDAHIEKPRSPSHTKLLELLCKARQGGLVVCPCYLPTFLELARQSDPLTLQRTSELMDILSGGVCLRFPEERIMMEILHFFRTKSTGVGSCYEPSLLAWTKITHVLGVMLPYNGLLGDKTNHVLQIKYFDCAWERTLHDMIQTVGAHEFYHNIGKMRFDFADKLNNGKFAHADELRSFPETILTEVGGFLDTIAFLLKDAAIQMCHTGTGLAANNDEIEKSDPERLMANHIYHCFRLGEIKEELPTIKIQSTLHAAIRWDRNRRFKDNDLLDIEHATGALPYCDFFLTEKSLCSLVTRKDIEFDRLYGCKVFSDPCLAVEAIEKQLVEIVRHGE